MKGNKPLVKDDAQVKIKIAAHEFPMWGFQQAWWTKDGWQHKDFVSRYAEPL
jgi:ABC-type antimicrobial peptide transport system ATPase subunit